MEAIIVEPGAPVLADGDSFCLRAWRGSGPPAQRWARVWPST